MGGSTSAQIEPVLTELAEWVRAQKETQTGQFASAKLKSTADIGENPPGTLAGLRQLLREQRADRDLDEETRSLMVRLENKLDRILRIVEDG